MDPGRVYAGSCRSCGDLGIQEQRQGNMSFVDIDPGHAALTPQEREELNRIQAQIEQREHEEALQDMERERRLTALESKYGSGVVSAAAGIPGPILLGFLALVAVLALTARGR